jgi:N-methylhydantoinase B
MFGVLAQIVPARAMAASEGGPTGVSIGGYHADRSPFVFVEFISSGWGGRSHKDGIDGITTPISNNSNTPAEVCEAEYPIAIECYEFAQDSGGPGAPSQNVLYRDGQASTLAAKFTMTMKRGDVLHHVQPGGGGFGDPLERDPERVLHDVRNEKVSVEAARRDYGVAVDTSTWTVDEVTTARLRRKVGSTPVEVPAD